MQQKKKKYWQKKILSFTIGKKVINATEVTGQSTADTTKEPTVKKGPTAQQAYAKIGESNSTDLQNTEKPENQEN